MILISNNLYIWFGITCIYCLESVFYVLLPSLNTVTCHAPVFNILCCRQNGSGVYRMTWHGKLEVVLRRPLPTHSARDLQVW